MATTLKTVEDLGMFIARWKNLMERYSGLKSRYAEEFSDKIAAIDEEFPREQGMTRGEAERFSFTDSLKGKVKQLATELADWNQTIMDGIY